MRHLPNAFGQLVQITTIILVSTIFIYIINRLFTVHLSHFYPDTGLPVLNYRAAFTIIIPIKYH
ncbi:hypothetical protein SAMN05216325_11163 [Nitrosomonas marina]|uniref:Uncharacterized protein n=1 Tax=Nitrosomonas marina TaxID=917 RepID=A0A1H8F2Z8_9PROT|nr:hypothetical protein SAMN05216325_11163 [Nitrosomonas marina]